VKVFYRQEAAASERALPWRIAKPERMLASHTQPDFKERAYPF
jgi:hypothetical protein